jgi:hypothetical protein
MKAACRDSAVAEGTTRQFFCVFFFTTAYLFSYFMVDTVAVHLAFVAVRSSSVHTSSAAQASQHPTKCSRDTEAALYYSLLCNVD